jgi:hypothetical protein
MFYCLRKLNELTGEVVHDKRPSTQYPVPGTIEIIVDLKKVSGEW